MTDKYRDALLTVIERYIRVKSSVSSDGGRLRADVALSHAMTDLENAAIKEEREAIVHWLRETADVFKQERMASKKHDTSDLLYHEQSCTRAARAIEDGEHLK